MPDTPELSRPATILAFDFGLRRIGVAVGQTVTGSASPLGTIANRDSGIDRTHVDLAAHLWTNPGETAGNGLDDDNNGIVDDIDLSAKLRRPIKLPITPDDMKQAG